MKKATTKTKQKELKVIDATGKTLGRLCTEIAMSLMGKTKATFEREKYSGFPVKVTNASKIKITPKKLEDIFHTRYSGHPGGLRILKASHTVNTKGFPELVKLSVYHMLPGNKLRREMMKHLTVEE
ncbi:MAG: 50S ribosomal protein L13 [Candidatus Nomurabacteria bacterium GW2011_GWA2_40_9]|uniref:50S ribosomal protein L13 n=1 Tax=Candidatus Nomurabacteria bacterium GW2011_GWA2_40_9 TaxID=1618734 RepID=A0A0G0TQQ9_9BACT|nr:MAG: 50S ribosomal protein L13 [Candidatus Nomurabacteria bacterium GW2011_GWA2_40_9]